MVETQPPTPPSQLTTIQKNYSAPDFSKKNANPIQSLFHKPKTQTLDFIFTRFFLRVEDISLKSV